MRESELLLPGQVNNPRFASAVHPGWCGEENAESPMWCYQVSGFGTESWVTVAAHLLGALRDPAS